MEAKCLLVLVLFDLIERLQATDACMDDIRLIQKATEAKAMEGVRQLTHGQSTNPRIQPGPIQMNILWPFAELMVNGKKVLSKQELLALAICGRAESLLPMLERAALQGSQFEQLQIQGRVAVIESLDKNKDGFLDRDEAPFENFDAIDLNGDGTLSKDEFLAHSKAKGVPQSDLPRSSQKP